MNKLIFKYKISTTLTLLSGLHIGDSKDNVEIGGVDSPVIRRKDNQQPYIPGSSLKGKIRCLLEQIKGASKVGDDNAINEVFGIAKDKNTIPSKIIFRDAYLTEESISLLRNSPNTDMPYTELKFENTIDRVEGKADHPRQQERIPAGVQFKLEFVVNGWGEDDEKAKLNAESSIAMLKNGLHALENDFLGGSGSRGYGHVQIDIDKMQSFEIKLTDN